jgi:hypothetical protein
MGFNLAMFFHELTTILAMPLTDEEKLRRLNDAIKAGERYARECGQLK